MPAPFLRPFAVRAAGALLAAAASLTPDAALHAQASGTGGAPAAAAPDTAADRVAVLAVVNGIFDAMRTGDSTAARAAFHPKAMLATATASRDGKPVVVFETVDAFAKSVGTPRTETLDERLYAPRVQLDGNLATVWTEYSFFVSQRFSHCGIDAFQLARTPDGWKIIALTDTRRRTGCRTS